MRIAVFLTMKEYFKNKLPLAAVILSALWLILYFSLGVPIFKNMWNTSPALPFTGGIFALAPLVAELLNAFLFKKRWLDISVICLSPLFALAHFLFFAFVISKLTYFFIAGAPYFITAGLAGLTAFFIFAFPKLNLLWKRISAVAVAAILAVICIVCVFGATPFYMTSGAVVFAVDGEYQIAFSTSHKSTGAVEIGGKTYYDEKNGENRVSKLHKICVPASVLEDERNYSVRTQSVVSDTAYLPTNGIIIEKNYSFRPIDERDGIQIYNLSDTHECIAGPANAASYFGDGLDLLILNGDIINDVSSEYQISLIYKLAHRVTKGAVPVIYTRGNHECNGKLAARLGEFVGCAERGFYFNYKIGNTLSLLVLDTANDMADDDPLISPIANFDTVRAEQTEWIKSVDGWDDCKYTFVVAHIAYPLSGYQAEKCAWHDFARELVELTNYDADFALCGHSHKTDLTFSKTEDNAVASFPVVRGSIRSDKYPDREGVSPFEFTGTAIEIKDGTLTFKFTNSNKRTLAVHIFEE